MGFSLYQQAGEIFGRIRKNRSNLRLSLSIVFYQHSIAEAEAEAVILINLFQTIIGLAGDCLYSKVLIAGVFAFIYVCKHYHCCIKV